MTETVSFSWFMLVVVAGLAFFLWASAIPQVVGTLTSFGADTTIGATVVRCPDPTSLAGQCEVSYLTQDGPVVHRLAHTGLIAVEVGEHVPVWVDPQGNPTVAGWRPYLDSIVLSLLGVGATGFALHWWRRVLDAPGPDASSP